MQLIKLTRGQVAIVDDCDAERLLGYRWRFAPHGNRCYAATHVNRRTRYMHRLILEVPPGMEVDHVNLNGLDNRRVNLRLCNRSKNAANRAKSRLVPSSSKFRGVSKLADGDKWRASIMHNRKTKHLGLFKSEDEAARAYDEASRRLFGMFGRVNFPRGGESPALCESQAELVPA